MKKALILLLGLSLSLAAGARNPKIGPGLSPGLGDGEGDGNETGGAANTEVSLPVGLPANGPDPSMGTNPDPASSPSNIVYTFDLNADNGVSSANQTHSALEKARDMNAACVLIRINSFAGGWDVAENIRQEIIGYDRPVMVYVNNQAIPAATFISTGADSIYTKKGSTISNKRGVAKPSPKKSHATPEEATNTVMAAAGSAAPSENKDTYSADATMNEILYNAGLSNLTVVEHNPGVAEKAINFLMSPFALLTILVCVGFIMRKTVYAKLPGPMMYVLAMIVLIYLAPYQLSGLASNAEIGVTLLLIAGSITAARYNRRWIAGTLLVLLTVTLSLVRAGDTDALLHYGSFSEMLSIPGMPLGLVILGWWLAKWREKKAVSRQQDDGSAVTGRLANAA